MELPYTLPQDSTHFILLREHNADIWLQKLNWIARSGGMALLDTHPDYMSFGGSTNRSSQFDAALYREFLNYLRQNYQDQYWHALPKEVAAFSLQVLQPNVAQKLFARRSHDVPAATS